MRKLRLTKGWSQEMLAGFSGLHRTYISQIENGARNPTLLIVEQLANALEVKPATLLAEEKRKS